MYIKEYIVQLVNDRLGGDLARFDELWHLVPDLARTLRTFDTNGAWLHWTRKTYDGWYCVQGTGRAVEVYYQERGCRQAATLFQDEREAIRFALNAAVITLG